MSKKKGVARRPPEGLVIDSSVAVAWCFGDEQDEAKARMAGKAPTVCLTRNEAKNHPIKMT